MKDDHLNGAHKRHEPTLDENQQGTKDDASPTSESVNQENERLMQGNPLQHERRDERGYIRVATPF
mgnify:FL=1|tara:strand:+ start:1104 stop:1301 length:198 start_codon:yes stop_codon:yes gene_type:complete